MEGIVFLFIISMVVRSLVKNSKEAKRKEAERQERGEAPPPPKPRSAFGFPGSLSEWIETLEGKTAPKQEAPVAPKRESVPAPPVSTEGFSLPSGSVPQGVSTEGCLVPSVNCEAPHSTLRSLPSLQTSLLEPVQEEAAPFAFLEGLPEVVKGVVYAEILTRPQQRRRLRP